MWSKDRIGENRSGRKNERTIHPERRQSGLVTVLQKKLLDDLLIYPNWVLYTLTTDHSLKGIGAILPQKQAELRIELMHMLGKLWVKVNEAGIIQYLSGNYLQSFYAKFLKLSIW